MVSRVSRFFFTLVRVVFGVLSAGLSRRSFSGLPPFAFLFVVFFAERGAAEGERASQSDEHQGDSRRLQKHLRIVHDFAQFVRKFDMPVSRLAQPLLQIFHTLFQGVEAGIALLGTGEGRRLSGRGVGEGEAFFARFSRALGVQQVGEPSEVVLKLFELLFAASYGSGHSIHDSFRGARAPRSFPAAAGALRRSLFSV